MSDEKKSSMHDVLCALLEQHPGTVPPELEAALGPEAASKLDRFVELQLTFRNNAMTAGAVRKFPGVEGYWIVSSVGMATDPKTGKSMPHARIGIERIFHAEMLIYVERMVGKPPESRIEAPPAGLIIR